MDSEKRKKKYNCCGGSPTCAINRTERFIDHLFILYKKDADAAVETLWNYMESVETERDLYRAKLVDLYNTHFRGDSRNLMISRNWGYYKVLSEGNGYKTKLLIINPRSKSKCQRHFNRKEIWTYINGPKAGQTKIINARQWHTLKNDTSSEMLIIETQLGDCKEEDIERKGE